MTAKKKPAKSSRARSSTPAVTNKQKNILIVGVGASAGGLKAFGDFFSHMTPDSGMAFILILHLDPTHVSMLPELLRKYTKMAVPQVKAGTKVEPDSIYIIPPNKKMTTKHGRLILAEPSEPRGLRLPIDTFFRSLAQDQGSRAIGVILSGTGTDGTMGARAIKEAGGLVIAQDLASAEFDGMPRSAIDAGVVDYVLAAEKIAEHLLMPAISSRVQGSAGTPALSGMPPDTLEKIFRVLRSQSGHDFSAYKKNMICRRIDRRMSIQEIENPSDYLQFLEQNAKETAALARDLLIGVTSFFRDPQAFKVLSRVLKGMLAKKPKDDAVRVWVPGCASGEEAYSIAIILRECMNALRKRFNVQIFATDIDSDAIETARSGIYRGNLVKDVTRERLRRFFLDQRDGYQVKKEIRGMVIFSIQDLVMDPPFTKLDLVSCRNLLIYLDAPLQRRLLSLFHYALRPDGILFLGSAETVGGDVDLFAERNRRWKIFKRRHSMHAAELSMPFFFDRSYKESGEIGSRAINTGSGDPATSGIAEKLLLDHYAPPCVLINKAGNILYTHGRTGKYLALPQGQASLNILAMARGPVRNALATLVHTASARKRPASLQGIRLGSDGKDHRLNLTATPYSSGRGAGELLLIAFEDAGPRKVKTGKTGRPVQRNSALVARLEQELWDAREQIQTVSEEKQSPEEELRSYNEELQSANEELQSMNEELETSKEELQSLNEELATVNAELQGKSEELSTANDDIRNLFDSTKIATLFLDTRLCVKRFTPEMTKIIDLVPEDIGRPLSHFRTRLVDENLVQNTQEVLDTLIPEQNEIRSIDGRWYLMRMTPYRAASNVIAGVVISFIDITERKQFEVAAEKAREFAEGVVETVREPLVVLDRDLTVVSANLSFYRRFNLAPKLAQRRSLFELNKRQWDVPELRGLLEKVIPEDHAFDDFTVEQDIPGLGRTIQLLSGRRIRRGAIDTDLILLAFEDVTDREKRKELSALAARLHSVREEERARLARELHDELSGSLTALKMEVALLPDRAAKNHKLFLEKLGSMSGLIDRTLARVRTIVTKLRPVVLDSLGLVAALEWQAREFQEHSGIVCEIHLPVEESYLDRDRATAVFRIFQESLTNVARHADAHKVTVDLRSESGKPDSRGA